MKGAPLTFAEARAVLRADEALDPTYEARVAAGTILGTEESDAWIARRPRPHVARTTGTITANVVPGCFT